MCESDGALGGNLSFEVLRCGDLVVTDVVQTVVGVDKKFLCCSVFE